MPPVVTLPKAAPPAPVRCTPTVDVAALLDRSARGYGSPAAVAADLPRWIRWTRTERDGAINHAEEIVDATRFREVLLAGAWTASGGVDAQGSWMNFSGPLVRLRAGDPPLRALHDWIVRRGYLTERAYDASCRAAKDGEGGPTLRLRARRPDLGDPELDFDAISGELLSASMRFERTSSVASSERITWSPPDERGVRWPVPSTGPDVSSFQTGRGVRCTGRGGVTVAGDECLAATPSSMQVHWPQEGITRLPMTLSAAAPLVRVKIGERDAWALLDSGAEACLVNANSPDAPRLTPSGSMDVESLTSVRVGPAIVDRLGFGGVTFTNVPAVVAPADLLYIDPLPAITFGYGLFESMAVRIDYARGEVVLARDAASLVGAGARRVPLRIASWAMLADVQVEGQPAVLTVDTGSSPALLLHTPCPRTGCRRPGGPRGLAGAHRRAHAPARRDQGAGRRRPRR